MHVQVRMTNIVVTTTEKSNEYKASVAQSRRVSNDLIRVDLCSVEMTGPIGAIEWFKMDREWCGKKKARNFLPTDNTGGTEDKCIHVRC